MQSVRFLLFTWWALLISLMPARAVLVFREDGRNLAPPTDPALLVVWKSHGSWQGGTGVAISPQWFITAAHLGVETGRFFDLNGRSYRTLEAAALPQTDLMLFRIEGTFSNWVPLWDESCNSELKHTAMLFGRGTARGRELLLPSGAKPGWFWGASDGKLSWGMNQIAEFYDAGPRLGKLLVWSWDRELGLDEATLSAGDSGGGVFLQDEAGQWRLAGVHFDVDPAYDGKDNQYSLQESGADPFWAAIHDARQLWRGVEGEPYHNAGPLEDHPAPMWAGASRIAPHAALIRSIIAPNSHEASKYAPAMVWGKHKLEALAAAISLSALGGFLIWKRRTAKLAAAQR